MSRKVIAIMISAWGPVLLVLVLMFIASSQPKYGPPPGDSQVYFSGVMPIFTHTWDALIKKSAHVLAYAGLAVLILRALREHDLTSQGAARLAILLAAGHALLDEWHQGFVPGRNSSPLDVGLDLIGALTASLVAVTLLKHRAGSPGNEISPLPQGDRAAPSG